MKKFLIVFVFLIVLLPVLSFAQSPQIVPCNGPDCGFDDFIKLIENIIQYIIFISAPLAACVVAYAGFIIMTSGVADRIGEAKKMIQKVVIGFFFILGAWIIVDTILIVLLDDSFRNIIKLN